MYLVTIKNGDTETVIHSPYDRNVVLHSGSIVQGASDEIESFIFSLLPDNPGYGAITPLSTLVEVWSDHAGRYEFRGRALTLEPQMASNGLPCLSVVCESRKGYLCDSVQPYMEPKYWEGDSTRTGLEAFIDALLDNHNSQVETYKRVYRGTVTVNPFNTSDNVYKGTNYQTTWACITDKLIGSFGGEVDIREGDDGKLYLDYVPELGAHCTTAIELGRNQKALARKTDPTSVITRLIPLGAKLEKTTVDEDGNETTETTEERLTIADVNDGVLWLDDEAGIAAYGIVTGTVIWDDVTVADNLLSKANEWMESSNTIRESYSVTALDLSLLGLDGDEFRRYNYYPVRNALLGIDTELRIVKKTIDVLQPQSAKIDMGDQAVPLSKMLQNMQKEAAASAEEIQTKLQKAEATANNSAGSVAALGQDVEQVKSDVGTLSESAASTSTSLITAASSSVTVKSVQLKRLGAVVQLLATFTATSSVTTLGTLADAWRPAIGAAITGGTIGADGTIKLSTSTGGSITIGGAWLV